MKFLHTSDWHVGRTLNGWSLLEEQEWAFQQIVDLAISEKVDGVVIAETSMTVRCRLWMRLSYLIRPWPAWCWRSRFLSMLSVATTMVLNVYILDETFFNIRVFI